MPDNKNYIHVKDNVYSLEPRYRKVRDEKYLKSEYVREYKAVTYEELIDYCNKLNRITMMLEKKNLVYRKIFLILFLYLIGCGAGKLLNVILSLF